MPAWPVLDWTDLTDLVDQPRAVTAHQLVAEARCLASGSAIRPVSATWRIISPWSARSAPFRRRQCGGVAGELAELASTRSATRGGVSPAHLALLATKLRTGRRSSR